MLVPIFSAIGGVFVTSSLVSESAEEQEKEKPLTKLKDEDPIIEEYEDANEGECKKTESKGCKGGQQGSKGQKGDEGGEGDSGEGSLADPSGSQQDQAKTNHLQNGEKGDDENVDSDESSPQDRSEDGKEGSQAGDDDSDQDSSSEDGKDGTENGDKNSEHAHAAGTKFGTVDRRMTREEIGSLTNMSSSLVDITSRLNAMLKAE